MTKAPLSPETSGSHPSVLDRSRADRKVFWVALGVSFVLHVIALFFYQSLLIKKPSVTRIYGPSAEAFTPEGVELVNLKELPDEADEVAPTPQEEPEAEPAAREAPSPGLASPENPDAQPGAPGPTAAEILRPKAGDLRVWAPVDPEIVALTDEEFMRLLLSAELENLADSMALAEEFKRRALDWTYTDKDGKKWGISPGKLHLGDVTLPLPGFSASPWAREQNGDRLWAWDDIERGAARKGVRDIWKERAEAIRRRKDAERRPDTTGTRRTGG